MAGAVEVRAFQVTCPAGTAQANAQTTNLTMPDREVLGIRVRIPPGPAGTMGFALGAANIPVLPVGPNTFIVADNEVIDWPLAEQINSGAWQAFMYNTGLFSHTIYILFTVQLPDEPAIVLPPTPIIMSSVPTPAAPPPVIAPLTLPPVPELI